MKAEPGTIYKLGDHILGCGSSTDQNFVERVAAHAEKIRMILTDPPYGVAYVEGKAGFAKLAAEKKTGGARAIVGDELQTEEQYCRFTMEWLQAITGRLDTYNAVYIFNSDLMYCALRKGMVDAGLYYSQQIIWVKNSVVVGRKDYLPQHEVIAYGWYGRHKMTRPKAKSVLFHPKPSRSAIHPTMKPVGLLRMILPNNTKTGEWVYDPFGGSGSTLIACEHMQRRCVMIELDPTYAGKIIERWEKLTGRKAEKIS
jgi:DNA modification methylase